MTEHLPECPVEKRLRSGKTVNSQTCICGALRACEERVRNDEAAAWLSAGHQVRHGALTDALEAVAALPFDPLNRDQGPAATQRQAIAAIDALRESND